MKKKDQSSVSIRELMDLMEHMRSEAGCPWDREQDFATIRNTFEDEFREAAWALDNEDFENLKEELGDVFWNIIFLSQLAKEKGYFDLEDVVTDMKKKITRRHPHVFAGKKLNSVEEVRTEYLKIKKSEKNKIR
ncbi:MAG: MazG nucleotide pyrophosphohydrolase domain-containing protein [Candidatus Altiarchaeota archaeon]